MKKQIFAIVLCTVLFLTVFAACGRYLTITDKEGFTHLAVLDENGNTVVDENGHIAVFNTDQDGKPVTDEAGEVVRNGVTFPEVVIGRRRYETPDFIWEFSGRWKISEDGLKKKGSSLKIEISSFQKPYDKVIGEGEKFLAAFGEDLLQKLDVKKEPFSLAGASEAVKYTLTAPKEEGGTIYFAIYYLKIHDRTYSVKISCDGEEKDEVGFDNLFAFFKVK